MEIVWQDPPASKRGSNRVADPKTVAFAVVLRENPKRWALWRNNSSSTITAAINKGRHAAFGNGFQAVVRNSVKSRGDIYVRYVGEPKPVPAWHLTWTDAEGVSCRSDDYTNRDSAKRRENKLRAAGMRDVELRETGGE